MVVRSLKLCRWPAQNLDFTYMSSEHQLYAPRKKYSNKIESFDKKGTYSEFVIGLYDSKNSKFLYAASINSKFDESRHRHPIPMAEFFFHIFDFSEFVLGPYGSTNSTNLEQTSTNSPDSISGVCFLFESCVGPATYT